MNAGRESTAANSIGQRGEKTKSKSKPYERLVNDLVRDAKKEPPGWNSNTLRIEPEGTSSRIVGRKSQTTGDATKIKPDWGVGFVWEKEWWRSSSSLQIGKIGKSWIDLPGKITDHLVKTRGQGGEVRAFVLCGG